jgi:8-oxo-dGTP diphosphatase
MSSSTIVHAAGGVVSRQKRDGRVEVLLIHRPHREDWTFPKGKLESGETHEECALREVEEETGLRCALGLELPGTSHIDGKGRLKVVRYWIMYSIAGVAGPRNEVDAVQWVSIERATGVLTYVRDRELLKTFADRQRRTQGAAS